MTSAQTILQSTNQHGADLDTRPQGMARDTIDYWIQSCPACGYCAPDITREHDQARELIRSESYVQQLHHPFFPKLANRFLCWALLRKATRNYGEAGWAALRAAWACDDAEAAEAAKRCRQLACDLFQQAQHAQISFAQENGLEAAVLADIFRRTGQFDQVADICQEGLQQQPEPMVRRMLLFQMALANSHEMNCYTMDDAKQFAEDTYSKDAKEATHLEKGARLAMTHSLSEIRYATGEIAQCGDQVNDNGYDAIVKEVVLTTEAMQSLGTDAPGLLLAWDISLPVFRPVTSEAWEGITFTRRGNRA